MVLLRLPLAAAMLASCVWIAYLAAIRLMGGRAPASASASVSAPASASVSVSAPVSVPTSVSASAPAPASASASASAQPATVPTHTRLAATALVALWLQIVVFTALASVHLFRLPVAAPLWIAGAVAAHRLLDGPGATRLFAQDFAAARAALREILASPYRAPLFAAGAALLGARLVRDLISPPLAWDAFLYHLYKPARWVQHGSFATEPAPDGWGYLDYFPHGGDVPWAWAMLPMSDDSLIAPAGVLVWSACVFGAYALARALTARVIPAGLAALAVGFIPAVVNTSTSSYADNFVLASFLLAAVFAVRLAEDPSIESAALAGSGFGLVASGKLSGIPTLGLSLAFAGALLLRSRLPRRARAVAIASAFAAASVAALPSYLRALIETGSPFYPLTVKFGEATLFEGNQELYLLYSGQLHNLRHFDSSFTHLMDVLFVPRDNPYHEHIGFGRGTLYIAALGAAGALSLLRRRGARDAVIFLAITAALPIVGLLSDSFVAHRTFWQNIIGRLLTPLPAIFAVFGARHDGRLARTLWVFVIVLNLLACVPQGFSPTALDGMRRIAPALVAGLLCAVILPPRKKWLERPHLRIAAGVLMLCVIVAIPLDRIRRELRYPIFATHNTREPSFQMHTLETTYASSWSIWRYLDDGAPHRLAVAVGWDGIGHNAFRYPLMGSRLQNTVSYVPVAKDGSVFDYRKRYRTFLEADFEAWVDRLVERGIDHVVTLHPSPIEEYWMEVNYDLFEPVITSTEGYNVAYRFNAARAAERRRSPRPHNYN